MSLSILEATVQLKKAEIEELEMKIKEELQKQFDYCKIEDLEKELRESDYKKELDILSVNHYKNMVTFCRDGKYCPNYLCHASINKNGTFILGYYSVIDGIPRDHQFSGDEGVYVRRREK